MSRRFTGLCAACGNRRRITTAGVINPHRLGPRRDDCEGGRVIEGTERCAECLKFRYDYHLAESRSKAAILPIRHKLDCSQRGEQP